MIIGYARTSTTDQKAGLEAQLRELNKVGCEKIFSEEVSSVHKVARKELEAALEFAREGDVIVVMKLDRLARSVAHLLELVETIETKGVSLRILDLAIDTATPTGSVKVLRRPRQRGALRAGSQRQWRSLTRSGSYPAKA